ncbi:MAG: alpha/beta hydrolase domain-containing protein, partial [Nevskiales bacterium]
MRFNILALCVCLCLSACSGGDGSGVDGSGSNAGPSTVPSPLVTGPIEGGLRGHALWDSWYDLAELGYVEEEYFISGSARTYPATTPADYTTRIIMRRPANAANFNGTVLLDWVNVTAQFENAVDSIESHEFFHRAGFAYVHVSAQSAGLCCAPGLTPKTWDPQRYEAISHPGDDYAFDMFSQIARAMKAPRGA